MQYTRKQEKDIVFAQPFSPDLAPGEIPSITRHETSAYHGSLLELRRRHSACGHDTREARRRRASRPSLRGHLRFDDCPLAHSVRDELVRVLTDARVGGRGERAYRGVEHIVNDVRGCNVVRFRECKCVFKYPCDECDEGQSCMRPGGWSGGEGV